VSHELIPPAGIHSLLLQGSNPELFHSNFAIGFATILEGTRRRVATILSKVPKEVLSFAQKNLTRLGV
jgi:hypothetical protein